MARQLCRDNLMQISTVSTPIVSKFANDPVLGPLLKEFLIDLPTQLDEIFAAIHAHDFSEVIRLCHRLKGDAATYGFPELALVAHEGEQTSMRSSADPGSLMHISAELQVIGGRVVDSLKN